MAHSDSTSPPSAPTSRPTPTADASGGDFALPQIASDLRALAEDLATSIGQVRHESALSGGAAQDALARLEAAVWQTRALADKCAHTAHSAVIGSQESRAPLDLGDVLMNVLPDWKSKAPRHSLELALHGELPPILANAKQVERAMDALLRVITSLDAGGETIRVSARPEQGGAVASVRNFSAVWSVERLRQFLGDTTHPPEAGEQSGARGDYHAAWAVIAAHGGALRVQTPPMGDGVALTTYWPAAPETPPALAPAGDVSPASAPLTHVAPGAPVTQRTQPSILIADADPRMARYLSANLTMRDVQAHIAADPADLHHLIDLHAPDIILLDALLPAMHDLSLISQLASYGECPIIVFVRHSDPLMCVRALDAGAVDCVAKPFSLDEVAARVRVALRTHYRTRVAAQDQPFACGDLRIDFIHRAVSLGARQILLSKTEYKLLRALAQHPGKVLTHDVLLERVWGPACRDSVEFLWVYIRRLRAKLEENPKQPRYILTAPGVGYRLAQS